jgi:hypothetical protein
VVISLDVDVMDPAYLPASELRVLVPAGRHADEQPERPSLADGPLESSTSRLITTGPSPIRALIFSAIHSTPWSSMSMVWIKLDDDITASSYAPGDWR